MKEEKVVIDFNNVSKKFCRNLKRSLIYGLIDIFKVTTGISKDDINLRKHEFIALDNVSFKIRKGESVGLIGHNGAGKTTSLKLINGLILPNKGTISVNGTVGALIALGTGFNPILTGRENIKIAAAVNGYTNKKIQEKFSQIVEFSEIGEFLDAPIQTYSSGMLARLGFSVAVHLNPDILLVDEVLAVGDLNFVIKCFNKISEFRRNGGSMLLVSHNMYNIRSNCEKAIWIEHGKVQHSGPSDEVCDEYEKYSAIQMNNSPEQAGSFYCAENITIKSFDYSKIVYDGRLTITIVIESKYQINKPIVNFAFYNMSNVCVISNTTEEVDTSIIIGKGKTKIQISYDQLLLKNGIYTINWVIASQDINNQIATSVNSENFEVKNSNTYNNVGIFKMVPFWSVERKL